MGERKRSYLLVLIVVFVFYNLDAINFHEKSEQLFQIEKISEESINGSNLKDPYQSFVVLDDSIYIADQTQHRILKFEHDYGVWNLSDIVGREYKLYYPGAISVLDGQYLVVNDFPHNRKLSVFKPDGGIYRIVRIEHPAYFMVALKNNKVAYVSWKNRFDKKGKQIAIYIKDIQTGEEKEVFKHFVRQPNVIRVNDKVRILLEAYYAGDVVVEKSIEGNLLVGITTDPKIDVYSFDGGYMKSFTLEITPIKVDKEMEISFKEKLISNQRQKDYWTEFGEIITKEISKRKFFDTYLPYYRKIVVGSDGNMLVFLESPPLHDSGRISFQVYSPEGALVQPKSPNFSLDFEGYKFDYELFRWYSQIQVTEHAIYAFVESKKDKETPYRIVKLK